MGTLTVASAAQLKAFTDPLRVRVLAALVEGAATNQQLANSLGEPQAKVLYHLRYLLKVGLIRLVETQVRGGNVEKYYRAVARSFEPQLPPALRPANTAFSILSGEVAASVESWPDSQPLLVRRGRRLSPAAAQGFYSRLATFIDDYWADHENDSEPADAPLHYCAALVFRAATAPEPIRVEEKGVKVERKERKGHKGRKEHKAKGRAAGGE